MGSDIERFSGIFRSSDSGRTWSRVPSFNRSAVWCIAFFPDDPNIIAAGTDEGVLISRDSGDTWRDLTREYRQIGPVVSLAFDPVDSKTMYVGTVHLPWKTTDGGASWESARIGMLDDSDIFSIVVDKRMRRRLFAATCGGLYTSVDAGTSWIRVGTPEKASTRVFFVAQHFQTPAVLFAGTAGGLLRSKDNGRSWQSLSPQVAKSIAFDARESQTIFIAADAEGLLRSENLGDTLEPVNQGFSNRRFTSLWAWKQNVYVTFQQFGESRMVCCSSNVGWTVSAWPEGPWLDETPIIRGFRDCLLAIAARPSFISPEGFISPDRGEHWRKVTLLPRDVTKLLFASSDATILLVSAGAVLYRTVNGGRTWERARVARNAGQQGPPEFMSIAGIEAGLLFAATSAGLYQSDDLGRTWTLSSGPFRTDTVQAIASCPHRENVLFAAHAGRIYRSEDAGRNWTIWGDSELLSPVTALVVPQGTPGRLLALTARHGVYSAPIPDF